MELRTAGLTLACREGRAKRWIGAFWVTALCSLASLPLPAASQGVWHLSPRPNLTLGEASDPAHLVFHGVTGALLLDDGSVAVADGGSREIRMLSDDGSLLRRFGRQGDGPGEFRILAWIARCGASGITSLDGATGRITRWTVEGEPRESLRLQGLSEGPPPYSARCGPNGRFAVMGWPRIGDYEGGQGPYRLEAAVGVLSPTGELLQEVGTFPGPERYRYSASDGPRPLGRRTLVHMGTDGVYVGTGDRYEIEVIGADGSRRRFGRPDSLVPMTADLVRVWHDSVVASVPEARRAAARRGLLQHEHPGTLPPYSDLGIDEQGFVWITRFGVPGERSTTLDVFSRVGDLVATLKVNHPFRLTDVGDDYILGVGTDDLGIERVYRYRLTRG